MDRAGAVEDRHYDQVGFDVTATRVWNDANAIPLSLEQPDPMRATGGRAD